MNTNEIMGIIEGLLFVCGEEGLSVADLKRLTNIPEKQIEIALNELEKGYHDHTRGLFLIHSKNNYFLTSKTEHNEYIKKLLSTSTNTKLSQAALETLAIVAYQQPITRVEIDEIRGVNSERSIQTLLARDLIEKVGKKETVGRPILFGTTPAFLAYFGLSSIENLPTLQDEFHLDELENQLDLFFDDL